MKTGITHSGQSGSVILEALIAILIFSIGVLALVGMQAVSIGNVADSKYRADAGFYANQIIGVMWANRTSATVSGVVTYAPDPSFACSPCSASNGNAATRAWAASSVAAALPNSTAAIAVSGAQVSVTLTWQPPRATTAHRHVAATYIN